MSVLPIVLMAAAAVGAVSFLLRFMLTRGLRRVERTINDAIADTADVVNDQALPDRWRRQVTRAVRRRAAPGRDEAAKRLVLKRLDRLIAQVERGVIMQGEARAFAAERLRAARERWAAAGWPEIAAARAKPPDAQTPDVQTPDVRPESGD